MTHTETLRLFVAAAVPDAHRAAIDDGVTGLKRSFPKARWVPRQHQHVTLKFLGSTPADRLDAVKEVCGLAARSRSAAEVALGGLGAFPGVRRARVLWVGLDDATALLAGLAHDLAGAFEALGYRTERRAFTPHLTIARFKVPVALPEPLPDLGAAELPPFEVSSVELFRSRLHPHGARYDLLETFPLG